MRHPSEWLAAELPGWVSSGIITGEQAQALRARYPQPRAALPWGAIIFGGLGAVIVGFGLILLLAYNWAALPKAVKLGAIGVALLATHGSGIAVLVRAPRWRALGDILCLLGTMIFGAGIWLVAQVYHLDAHYPNAFLAWGLGALAMAWLVPSLAQGALAAVLLTIWCGCETMDFRHSLHLGPLLLAAGLLPLAWRQHSRFLMAVLIPALITSLLFVGGTYSNGGALTFSLALSLGALLIALGLLARRYPYFPEAAPGCQVYGWILFLITLYTLTWPDVARDLLWFAREQAGAWGYWGVILALAIAAWGLVLATAWRRRPPAPATAIPPPTAGLPPPPPDAAPAPVATVPAAPAPDRLPYEWLLVPLTVLLAAADQFLPDTMDQWAAAGPFNLVMLALAAMMMTRGVRGGRLGPTVCGSLLLIILMASRYADLFHELWLRGLIFIVVGAVLIGEAVLVLRARLRRPTGGAP